MTYIAVRLDGIQATMTRAVYSDGRKSSDVDVVTFVVLLNQTSIGQGVATLSPVFSGNPFVAEVGNSSQAQMPPATNTLRMTPHWVVPPFEVRPGDGVTIMYTGTNISDGLTEVGAEKQAQIEIKVLDALVSAAVGAVEGMIGAAVSSVLGAIGDPIGKLLGFATTPKCDGLLFSDTLQFTGDALGRLDYGPVGATTDVLDVRFASEKVFTKSYTDSATHSSSCGAVATTNVTFSIVKYDKVSVRSWASRLQPFVPLSQGISKLSSGRRPISVKALI